MAFQQGQALGNRTVGPLGQRQSPSAQREDPPTPISLGPWALCRLTLAQQPSQAVTTEKPGVDSPVAPQHAPDRASLPPSGFGAGKPGVWTCLVATAPKRPCLFLLGAPGSNQAGAEELSTLGKALPGLGG